MSEPDALVITMTKHGQAVREVTANIMIDHARTPEEYLEGLVTGMYCSLKKRIEEAAHNIQPPSGGIQEVK